MSTPTAIKLIAVDNGKEFIFGSIVQASEFLQRSKQYLRCCIYDTHRDIITGYDKREYYFTVLGIGQRKNAVTDPNYKRKQKLPPLYDENGELIRRNENHQLCWDCARASGFCSWSMNLEPVEGWEAKSTHIRHMSRGGCESEALIITNSYKVKKCPLFVRDGATAEERKEQRRILMEELENGG